MNQPDDTVENSYSLFYFTCDFTKLLLLQLQERGKETLLCLLPTKAAWLSKAYINNREQYPVDCRFFFLKLFSGAEKVERGVPFKIFETFQQR